MTPKFNLWEREDEQKWSDYIKEEIKVKSAWYELRYGTKYFDNQDYKIGSLVDITVGKNPETALTVLTLKLVDKQKTLLKNVPEEYMGDGLENLVKKLRSIYGDQVTVNDDVTMLEFII